MTATTVNDVPVFSLVEGGATHELVRRFVRKRTKYLFYQIALVAAIFCWLPLMLLSIFEGVAWGDRVAIPFFYDLAVHTRFLVAVPLFIIAEAIIGPMLMQVAVHIATSGRIRARDLARYKAAVAEGLRLRDSKLAEGIVFGVALVSTVLGMFIFAQEVPNWRWLKSGSGVNLTLAAYWYAFISVPIFQFLFYRWLLRMFNWSRFLYRVSRLDLKLLPTHPDRAGGIGFIGENQRFFAFITFALGAVFSGIYGNEILYENFPIAGISAPAATIAIVLVLYIQLPAIFFFPMLRIVKRRAIFEYGALALSYTSEFDKKWIRGKHDPEEQLMGSGDIQSLADLGNSYLVVEGMRLVPFGWKTTAGLAASFILPILPLFLTVMPLKDIVKTVMKVLT
ncbi:MAG: hypothetical protein DMF63_05525 [Acidobacteria bacterium]|nr:MAG: hypothetical protein DMF63_05525 [Acidobacteriota bacterium]